MSDLPMKTAKLIDTHLAECSETGIAPEKAVAQILTTLTELMVINCGADATINTFALIIEAVNKGKAKHTTMASNSNYH